MYLELCNKSCKYKILNSSQSSVDIEIRYYDKSYIRKLLNNIRQERLRPIGAKQPKDQINYEVDAHGIGKENLPNKNSAVNLE